MNELISEYMATKIDSIDKEFNSCRFNFYY